MSVLTQAVDAKTGTFLQASLFNPAKITISPETTFLKTFKFFK